MAEMAVEAGYSAIERRIVEVDQEGRLWTNGRLGYGFPTSCQWSTSPQSGQTIYARQDGPSLCAEDSRSATRVELLDESGTAVAEPEVCVAVLSQRESSLLVSLTLQRTSLNGSDLPFDVELVHCIERDFEPPFTLNGQDIVDSTCPDGKAVLLVGEPGSQDVGAVESGTWRISELSTARDGRQRGVLDLKFRVPTRGVYWVRGAVDLPQVFE